MFYYIALKYGNFLLETVDTFLLLKDAYTVQKIIWKPDILLVWCFTTNFEWHEKHPTEYYQTWHIC